MYRVLVRNPCTEYWGSGTTNLKPALTYRLGFVSWNEVPIMATKSPKFKSVFTLGGVAAEADDLRIEAFYNSSDYAVISSRTDPRCFIIGRTGSGKSAALQHLQDDHPGHVIRINPENLALPYITNLQLIQKLDRLEVDLDLFWSMLWKHVLLIEIIKHRYHVNSATAKQNFFTDLREKIKSDHTKRQALDYLEQFEDRFWEDTDVRIRGITESFRQRVDEAAGVQLKKLGVGVAAEGGKESENFVETRREEADRYQRIVNDNQLTRLNAMLDVLDEYILDDDQNFTYVVIDDLDREWVDERITNDLIRCLFRTVLDLKRVGNLKILVALRTNIFQELDFGRKSRGQEEKFRGLVLDLKWSSTDLEEMLDERVNVAAAKVGLTAKTMDDLLPNPNKTRGNALDYIIDRTLMRPRDAIAFSNECFIAGADKNKLTWEDIQEAEPRYSGKMLLSLRDEWKSTYPSIDKALEKFRGSPMKMTREDLTPRLDEILLLVSDPKIAGVGWLTAVSNEMWNSPPGIYDFKVYQPLLEILYSTGLVGCATRDRADPVYYFEDPQYITRESTFTKALFFHLHRTYHAGLEIKPGALNS
jgi:hypothetical protein